MEENFRYNLANVRIAERALKSVSTEMSEAVVVVSNASASRRAIVRAIARDNNSVHKTVFSVNAMIERMPAKWESDDSRNECLFST